MSLLPLSLDHTQNMVLPHPLTFVISTAVPTAVGTAEEDPCIAGHIGGRCLERLFLNPRRNRDLAFKLDPAGLKTSGQRQLRVINNITVRIKSLEVS